METKKILRVVCISALLLLLPLLGMQFSGEVNWSVSDFIIAAILLIGTGLTYEFMRMKVKTPQRRITFTISLALLLIYVWAELALGILDIPGISGS